MIPLSQCSTLENIPAKSKSKIKIFDLEFFIKEKGGLFYIYECSTKKQLLVVPKTTELLTGFTQEQVLNFLVKEYTNIKKVVDEYNDNNQ